MKITWYGTSYTYERQPDNTLWVERTREHTVTWDVLNVYVHRARQGDGTYEWAMVIDASTEQRTRIRDEYGVNADVQGFITMVMDDSQTLWVHVVRTPTHSTISLFDAYTIEDANRSTRQDVEDEVAVWDHAEAVS